MSNVHIGAMALGALAMIGCAHQAGGARVLDQGWSDEDRRFFYHTTQGTRLIPMAWFLALEQPSCTEPFATSRELERHGALLDPDTRNNPDRLPVGFAKDIDAATHEAYLGFTCAACHTGQLTHRGATIRVDGGPAMIDVVGFTDALFAALSATAQSPEKFGRFARAVLGGRHDQTSARALHEQVDRVLALVRLTGDAGDPRSTVAGFGRLDALNRAANLLFAQISPENLRPTNAPVSYPFLWDTPQYDWVQWNGSIEQPMGRNIGEALGVGAHVEMGAAPGDRVRTSVRVDNLHALEELVKKLEPPRWPEDLLGPIDRVRAARGKVLYTALCASCHEPELAAANEYGKRFLSAKMVPLDAIGTDPTVAVGFHVRTVDTGALGLGTIPAAEAIQLITSAIRRTKYDEYGLSSAERLAWDGYRENVWRAPLAYRARSLRGIWATAPYLHNGSVPNLYELLLPADRRSRSFRVGDPEIDVERVGLPTGRAGAGFELSTDVTGNSNMGHELRDGPLGDGVVGRALTDDERWALVEYLKTL